MALRKQLSKLLFELKLWWIYPPTWLELKLWLKGDVSYKYLIFERYIRILYWTGNMVCAFQMIMVEDEKRK